MSPRNANALVIAVAAFALCCAVAFQYLLRARGTGSEWFSAKGGIARQRDGGDGGGGRHPAAWEGWRDARLAFFGDLQQRTCQFPRVYEPDGEFHKRDFRRGFVAEEGNWRLRHERLAANEDAAADAAPTRGGAGAGASRGNMTFVHIGKAGGTSLSCEMRIARGYFHCRRGNANGGGDGPPPGLNESAISRLVDCYTHYNLNRHCFTVNRSFVVNVRHPFHRITSWYLYEHIANFGISQLHMPDYYCGQLMLYTCYGQLDHLATVGLAGPRPSSPSPDGGLRVGTNLTAEECKRWAWAAVQGTIPADLHNAFNYDWYAHRLLEGNTTKNREFFVIRIEHVERDWPTVDHMVGGTGSLPGELHSLRRNDAASKPLVVSNGTVSLEGTANLCRALCREIQVYKRLLARAANLDAGDLATSMTELRRICPEEVDLAPGKCPE